MKCIIQVRIDKPNQENILRDLAKSMATLKDLSATITYEMAVKNKGLNS